MYRVKRGSRAPEAGYCNSPGELVVEPDGGCRSDRRDWILGPFLKKGQVDFWIS